MRFSESSRWKQSKYIVYFYFPDFCGHFENCCKGKILRFLSLVHRTGTNFQKSGQFFWKCSKNSAICRRNENKPCISVAFIDRSPKITFKKCFEHFVQLNLWLQLIISGFCGVGICWSRYSPDGTYHAKKKKKLKKSRFFISLAWHRKNCPDV